MKKNELLTLTKDALGLASKSEAEGFLKEIDSTVEALGNGLEVGDKVKLGNYLSIEKRHVEEKQGEMTRDGEKVPYVTPAHDKLVIKPTKALKELIK